MRPRESLPASASELDGVRKVAILLLSVGEDAAAALLKHLPVETVEQVTRAVAELREVPAPLATQIVEEFYRERLAGQETREGGLEYASSLLKTALEPERAEGVIEQLEARVRKTPFSFLEKAGSESLLTFIQDEHPQTIALIVSHLPQSKASEVLDALAPEKQIDVVRRVAYMEQTSPEVVRQVESALASRLSSLLVPAERVGGVESVAEMLNLCDRTTEKNVLEGIETDDPDLVESIRRLMFVFEDILLVDDKGIQAVLKEVDNDELCLALRTASEPLKERIFSNMSSRAADLIREEMEYMGPVRLSDVEMAQQRIVDIVRRFEDAGELFVSGRGGDDQIV